MDHSNPFLFGGMRRVITLLILCLAGVLGSFPPRASGSAPSTPSAFLVGESSHTGAAMTLARAQGDSSAIQALRDSALSNDGYRAWRAGRPWDANEDRFWSGIRAVASLAAMGDSYAHTVIMASLLDHAGSLTDSTLVSQALSLSGKNYFTWGHLPLAGSLRAPMGSTEWEGLQLFLWQFIPYPKSRDAFLEELLASSKVTDAEKLLLISSLNAYSSADLDTIESVWHRAMNRKNGFTTCDVWMGADVYEPETLNVIAWLSVQVLDRLRRADRLWTLQESAPDVLRDEILYVLAGEAYPKALNRCLQMAINDWPKLAASKEYVSKVSRTAGDEKTSIWWALGNFDSPRRTPLMASRAAAAKGAEWWKERWIDPDSPELLKIFWISLAATQTEVRMGREGLQDLEKVGNPEYHAIRVKTDEWLKQLETSSMVPPE